MARNQLASLPPLASARDWDYIMSHHMAPRLAEAQLNAQSHSRQSSSHSTVSDSSPISTTFSVRTRSSSSIASSPPHIDHQDITTISAKKSLPALPDVAEDPREKENTPTKMKSCFTSLPSSPQLESRRDSTDFTWEPVRRISVHNAPGKYYDEFYVGSEERLVVPKRKQSANPPTDLNIHIATQPTSTTNNSAFGRIVSRMPSLSRRLSSRKPSAASVSDGKVDSPKLLSRAGSFRKSLTSRSQDSYTAVEPSQLAAKIETILEDHDLQASPVEISPSAQASYFDNKPEQPVEDPIVRSITPLLPPLLEAMQHNQEPIQSPLASPTVAPVSSFVVAPTAISPTLSGPEAPPLSAQPSTGSFGRSRAPTLLSEASQIPPLVIAGKEDKWATQLGHADFTILPQPYCPQTCDMDTINQLIKARQDAIESFAVHLHNTAVLYGDDSKVYRLVQERWAEIQAEWQEYLDDTVKRGHAQGFLPMRMTPLEPAALTSNTPSYVAIKPTPMATTSDSNGANISASAAIDFAQRPSGVEKTARLGADQSLLPAVDDFKICNGVHNILGPMAVQAPQPQPGENKRGQLKRMFSLSGFRSPRPRSQ